MIKCRLVKDDPAPCGKVICCHYCDEKETCKFACEDPAEDCEEKEEVPDDLQVMENSLSKDVIQRITDMTIQIERMKFEIEEFKEGLLKAMEKNGIKKFENEQISFTYIAPTTRKTLDRKALEKAHPELDLSQFDKVSNVKSSVRIKVK